MKKYKLIILLTIMLAIENHPYANAKTTISKICMEKKFKNDIIKTLPADIRDKSNLITDKYNPAKNTDLYFAIKNKGALCLYGVNESGLSIFITPDKDKKTYNFLSKNWIENKMKERRLNKINGFALNDNESLNPEIHSFEFNYYYKGYIIKLSSTYIYELNDFAQVSKIVNERVNKI